MRVCTRACPPPPRQRLRDPAVAATKFCRARAIAAAELDGCESSLLALMAEARGHSLWRQQEAIDRRREPSAITTEAISRAQTLETEPIGEAEAILRSADVLGGLLCDRYFGTADRAALAAGTY